MRRVAAIVMFGAVSFGLSSMAGNKLLGQTFTPAPQVQKPTFTPVPTPQLSKGQLELIELEGKFSKDVAERGGKAFASWFADDAVTLNNGKPATLGLLAIASSATWDPKDYQLSWYPEGAQMGPLGDTGFTWGHYNAVTKDAEGKSVTLGGRYITFWKKVKGAWKVALDASADDAPASVAPPFVAQP